MSIELEYRVHGANVSTAPRKVMFEGQEMDATVTVLDVELAWDDRHVRDHGSLTLRFVGQDIDEARRIFLTDGKVLVTFEPVSDDPEAGAEVETEPEAETPESQERA